MTQRPNGQGASEPILRTALVTGGNRGLGLAICRHLAEAGHRVVLAARDPDDAEAAADDLEETGAEILPLQLDLASPESLGEALELLAREGVEVDVLVNNAGVYPEGALLDVPVEGLLEAMAVHLFGPLELTRALIPDMRRKGWGRVVNVSSSYGSFAEGLRGPGAYAVSKAAMNAMTLRLARELEGTNVKVNAVCPGWVRTRMGGPEAPRSPESAAADVVWCALLPDDGPTGTLFRDRRPLPW